MSPLAARRLVAFGVFNCAVMWVFLFLTALVVRDALAHAGALLQGDTSDLSGVTAATRRMQDIALIGAPFGLVGYVTLLVGVHHGARARWIYRCGVALSVSYLLLFPLGTILGIVGLVQLRRSKPEHLAGTASLNPQPDAPAT